MVGAIEFLRKAKEICNSKPMCHKCEISVLCNGIGDDTTDEADLVSKVMAYKIKEATHD